MFALFYLATLFGIEFMITRQISKLINAKLAVDGSQESRRTSKDEPMVQLPPKVTAQLEEYRQPASVVDSTTRTLDEIKLHER